MYKPLLAAAALLVSTAPIRGQSHDHSHEDANFNRSIAIRHALEFNKDLIAVRQSITRAEAKRAATGITAKPRIGLNYQDDFAFNNEGESSLGLSISKKFPLAKRLAKEKAVSEVDIERARAEVRKFELDLVAKICDFDLDIHLLDTRIEHLKALRIANAASHTFALEKAKLGEISTLEANQLGLELRILEQDIQNLHLERERLIHMLGPFLGRNSSDHLTYETNPNPSYYNKPLPDFDFAVLERAPAFQLALLAEKSAEAEIALAGSKSWDNLTAALFWENEKSVDQPIGRTSDQTLGVSFSIPLPYKKRGVLLAQEKIALRDQSRLTASAIRFRIQNDIEHARHEASITQSRMEAYRSEVIDLAQEQLTQTQLAYQNGHVGMLTLLRAQEQRLGLENGYLELYEQYAHALLELELARIDIPELNR